MRSHHPRARQLAALGALAALALPRAATPETVDDTFLLTTSVSPNVILILDNSYAMNHIEWHPAFDPTPAVPPVCSYFDNNTVYLAADIDDSLPYCGQTREVYAPNIPTLWDGRYLNWYYSLNPLIPAQNQILDEIQNNVVVVAGCNVAGSGTRFVSQYRRTRADASRQVFFDVLCLSEPKGLRFGLGIFRDPAEAATPQVDPNGGFLRAAVDDNTPAHAAELEAHIGNTQIDQGGTPLTEAVFQFYSYLMPRTGNAACAAKGETCPPLGNDNATQFPAYVYNKFGADSAASGGRLPDPVEVACQKNYMILVTSGLATRDDFDRDPASTSQGFNNFGALIGDYYAENVAPLPNPDVEVPGTADERTLYLDDLVKYMQDKDLRPDFDDDQTIDFYTIGFGTTPEDNAYLQRVSETVGDGIHFEVKDGASLSQALVDALNDIVEKSRSFTAATVPSARTSDGGDFYNSFFLPSDKTAFWEGHLRAWHFTAAGEIVDRDGHCALVDPDGGGECNDGPFHVICQAGQSWPACVNPFWDAGDATRLAFVPGASNSDTGARQLYTSTLNTATPPAPVRTDFDMALTAADLEVQTFATPGIPGFPVDPSPNSGAYVIKKSQALNAEGLADEVVAYARGCFFGTGVLSTDVQPAPTGNKPCEERPWLIGDIFHSDPIVVRNPPERPFGPSYDAFRTTYGTRDRVIYTGTNGGFLEAFHAGDWSTSLQKYGTGSGEELFGFMPWEPRTQIKEQPIDDPADRHHYVDGAPQVSDAWFYNTATDATKAEAHWHTVLVGGLREGGSHYYALDVTNSSQLTGPGKPAYPSLLWEFPNEDDFNSGTGDYLNMGETWGQAVITRVKLRNGCDPPVSCDDNSGQGFERWVAIVAGGYDITSDKNPVQVDPSSGYVATSTKGRAIYMLDLKTGEVIAEQKVATPGTPPPLNTGLVQDQMQYALVATPAVLDLDGDGFADVVYVGDLGGNVFKWVIKPIGEDRANDGSSLRTQPAWKFQHFFQAPAQTISGTGPYYKNIFQPPAAAFVGNTLWIAFGTGERAAIGYTGNTSSLRENNRFYALTDPDPLATSATTPAVLAEADLTNISVVGTTVTSPRGYYFIPYNPAVAPAPATPADGEKFVTTTVIFAGKVITASFTPSLLVEGDPGWDPCTQRGSGRLYIFDLKTGVGSFDDGAGNEQRFKDIGLGLPTDPKISIGVGGNDNKVVIQKSGTDIEILDADDVTFGRGIIYWRELH